MLNAIKLYRISHFLYKKNIPFLPKIIKGIIFILYNSIIPYECEIGKGTLLGYGGIAVVIHKNAVIGRNCVISQCVTIGGKEGANGVPVIGDNVFIGAGAKVLGRIKVESNSKIGANAVVLRDVPEGKIAVGIPATIKK
ncbi:DapH/DapD/GlmU-related protein [Clostridium sp. 1001275B_160808_H3]|uniref:serine O-acetyltransferase n=1 Tax=Clostridium sp. 1001275B_160808_H3 TaxID=2787110 RepID=UPI001A9B0478|nr:DapH/DapD/GlmU-related protein [Clostridium sp. 1001275B_160808_H3]